MIYRFIAIVLVYRNADDLIECIESMKEKIPLLHIIVVNAFYDDESYEKIRKISINSGCDFLNIENRGYSYGNNFGIEYARSHYEFDYIIISNPDVVIVKFDETGLENGLIYAPKIVSRSGNDQNPMVISHNVISEALVYRGLKTRRKTLVFLGLTIGKLSKKLSSINKKAPYRIYQAHGSFVILHKNAVECLHPIYDENMFLFAEEGVLAIKAMRQDIKTVYIENIIVHHKEDGSMSFGDYKINDELAKSNIYFYENYVL